MIGFLYASDLFTRLCHSPLPQAGEGQGVEGGREQPPEVVSELATVSDPFARPAVAAIHGVPIIPICAAAYKSVIVFLTPWGNVQ